MSVAALESLSGSARAGRSLGNASFRTLEILGTTRLSVLGVDGGARRRLLARGLQRGLAALCEEHRLVVRVSGTLPRAPAIVVANHVSYLDPVVLGGLVPSAPIAKQEVARWPLVGAAARSLGVIFVDRSSPMSGAMALRAAALALVSGVSVLGFPEGTTTDGGTVLPFRRGLFGLAQLLGVPVVPAAVVYEEPALAWTGDMALVPHYLRTAARRRTEVAVRFDPPLAAAPGLRPDELAELARWHVASLLL